MPPKTIAVTKVQSTLIPNPATQPLAAGETVNWQNNAGEDIDVNFASASWPFDEPFVAPITIAAGSPSGTFTAKGAVVRTQDPYSMGGREGESTGGGDIDLLGGGTRGDQPVA